MAQGPERERNYSFQAILLIGIILLSIALIAYYGFWKDRSGADAGTENPATVEGAVAADE